MTVKSITHNSPAYWQSIELRDLILRKPLGLVYDQEELAQENDSYHLACYNEQEQIIGCLVLKPVSNTEIKMRQVAVAENQQGKGVGKLLVKYSEAFVKEKGFSKITLHARKVAYNFYIKLNYQSIGSEFLEVGMPHYKMEKSL